MSQEKKEKIIEEVQEHTNYSEEIIDAYIECHGVIYLEKHEDAEEIAGNIEESYYGEFDSDGRFAQDLVYQTESLIENLPTYIYIDWERTSRDLMMDYVESNGHYFRQL